MARLLDELTGNHKNLCYDIIQQIFNWVDDMIGCMSLLVNHLHDAKG